MQARDDHIIRDGGLLKRDKIPRSLPHNDLITYIGWLTNGWPKRWPSRQCVSRWRPDNIADYYRRSSQEAIQRQGHRIHRELIADVINSGLAEKSVTLP